MGKEVGSGWGETHIPVADAWRKPSQYCKAIILPSKLINLKNNNFFFKKRKSNLPQET